MSNNSEHLALLKFGLNIPLQQREEVIRLIKSNPTYKDDFENIKNSLKTMTDEDEFLGVNMERIRQSTLHISRF
jgi:hypothetical protein